jgi:uncharacterized 2Fe-2S/4Fe-4S cluster protein (DUF4445 family)
VPEDRAYETDAAIDLYLAAASAGILVEQPCGSRGTCGRCRVRVIEGAPSPTDAEQMLFTPAELAAGWRLGCQLVIQAPAVIEIPAVARSLAGKSFGPDLPPEALARPVVTIASMPGHSGDSLAALDAVGLALGVRERSLRASPGALTELARARADADEVNVAVHDGELLAAWAGSLRPRFGLAIDIGTTSLAAAIVSLCDGAVAASSSSLNPQAAFGADVISRIRHALEVPAGGSHLMEGVRSGLATLVAELTADAGCGPRDIVLAAAAGNPTMMHAWLGVPAGSLGRAPYAAVWSDAVTLKAESVGLPIHPNADVLVFPLIRSHVGGDAVAAAVASGLECPTRQDGDGPRLLIDLGTNTELLLAYDGRLVATSAAAGPAFEGVSILHGMRGAPGAIDVVSISPDGRVAIHTIGGVPAKGICGSGLIDAVAELLRAGVVSPSGYLRKAEEVTDDLLAARLAMSDGQRAFTLAEATDAGGAEVSIAARDIREVQLAKGSIVAAAGLLCGHVGLTPADLAEVLIAGAFGNHLRKSSALRIGLVPPIDPERVRLVGNAAGVGARLALVDRDVFARARALAARAEYVDLATHSAYQAAFIEALEFPEP